MPFVHQCFLVRGNIQKHQGMSDYLKKSNRPLSLKALMGFIHLPQVSWCTCLCPKVCQGLLPLRSAQHQWAFSHTGGHSGGRRGEGTEAMVTHISSVWVSLPSHKMNVLFFSCDSFYSVIYFFRSLCGSSTGLKEIWTSKNNIKPCQQFCQNGKWPHKS